MIEMKSERDYMELAGRTGMPAILAAARRQRKGAGHPRAAAKEAVE